MDETVARYVALVVGRSGLTARPRDRIAQWAVEVYLPDGSVANWHGSPTFGYEAVVRDPIQVIGLVPGMRGSEGWSPDDLVEAIVEAHSAAVIGTAPAVPCQRGVVRYPGRRARKGRVVARQAVPAPRVR